MLFLIPMAAVLLGVIMFFPFFQKEHTMANPRKRVALNAGVFLISVLLIVMLAMGVSAQSEEPQTGEPAPASQTASDSSGSNGYMAAAVAVGLSCLGAGIAIASTAPAAIGAFSEDPKAFGKALIFVVLGEGVALYGLLISILIINKL